MNLKTRLRSTVAQKLSSERTRLSAIRRARRKRQLRRQPPHVDYFHQADDPFSVLTAQKLDALRQAYSLPFNVHHVSGPSDLHQGDSTRFAAWAQKDAAAIAPHFGVELGAVIDIASPTQAEVTGDGIWYVWTFLALSAYAAAAILGIALVKRAYRKKAQ